MVAAPKNPTLAAFEGIATYVASLQALAYLPISSSTWKARCHAALNGEANQELRRKIPLDTRRLYGAFFTGTKLSRLLLSHSKSVSAESFFYDPTCGMGDLLLAAASLLPLQETPSATLRAWGRQLAGADLHQEFIDGTKARLALLAAERHGVEGISATGHVDHFPLIQVGDGLIPNKNSRRATHLLLNPPFGAVSAPEGCTWASGKVTAAAIFTAATVKELAPNCEVLAILPDVLRSGTFSENWRKAISDIAEVHLVKPYGIFDASADVDVFLLRLTRRGATSKSRQWPATKRMPMRTLGDAFNVCIGRVVPYRDQKVGIEHPYIHPRCVPPWSVMSEFTETRKHQGKAFQPPFVVIRRTSRPEHPYRAVATVITGNLPVAVENHLIVCQPKDGALSSCKRLMQELKSDAVNVFLNDRIRCRHLTVGAVGDIPVSQAN
ncbi:N-6 DNA methylase [Solimonas sp. SE-A11]|nr:N-6 DNA methylase [Solimonas sp. SE-A11]